MEKKSTMLEHVLYEFDMYIHTYIWLIELSNSLRKFGDNQFFINMAIESHQIHLRNLIEFFSETDGRENDLRIKDIVKNYKELILKKDHIKFNHISRSVEHLTKDRTIIDKQLTIEIIKNYFPEFEKKIKAVVNGLDVNIKEEYKDEIEINSDYINKLKEL